MGIGTVTGKKALMAGNIGIFNLGFWTTAIGWTISWFYYSCQYFLDNKDSAYFNFSYQLQLLNVAGIFIFLILVDTFNYACLMHITKTGQVSKAAVYSTLNATWTIAFGIIRGEYGVYVLIYL